MKKITAFLIGIALISTLTTSIFAQSVTDIKGHWGEQYIQDVIGKGLAKGYDNGKFLPDGSTTRIEAVIFVANMYPDSKITSIYNSAKDKWTSKLREHNIPSWADKYMVFGLEIGIYPETFLKHFIDDAGKQNPCLRYEFITFMVNALGFKNEFASNPSISFDDASTINAQVLPYVEVMVRKGIIVGTGNFNATDKLTRAQVAVILSNSYKYSEKGSGVTPSTDKSGRVVKMTMSNNKATIQVVDNNGNTNIYTADESTVTVLSNGTKMTLSDIKIGQNIKYIANGNSITKIDIINPLVENTVKGEFVSYSSLEMDVLVDGKLETYEINPSLPLQKGSKTITVLDLIAGEEVQLEISNNKVISGSVKAISKTVDGTILSIVNNEIKVQESTGTFTYFIDNTPRITIDRRVSNDFRELSVGDLINGQIVDSEFTNIDAITIQRTIKNVVLTGITQSSSGNILTFKDADDTVHEFITDVNTTYVLKGRNKKISDMELGFECDILVKGGKLLTVDTQGEYRIVKLGGVVESVDVRNLELIIKDNLGNEHTISIEADTIINGFNSSDKKTIRNIFDGDNVLIEGLDNNSTILATKIIFWS